MTEPTITQTAAAQPFAAAFAAALAEVEAALCCAPAAVREYTSHLALSKGKCIRAASLIACAMGDDGLVPAGAVCLAAAVELLHLATLVHDDVMDDAKLRRGMPTLQNKYGKRTAVICGDYLLCVAIKAAAPAAQGRDGRDGFALPDYVSRVCLGELNQHVNNNNLELSVRRYLRIISGKTAALFEASFYAGGMLCAKEAAALSRYARLGHAVGMIFQLADDCNDFELGEGQAQKPVKSDYEQGVITLPLIHALQKSPEFKEEAQQRRLPRSVIDSAVSKTGGLVYARFVSKHYYDRATRLLGALCLPQEKRALLQEVLEKAYLGQPRAGELRKRA